MKTNTVPEHQPKPITHRMSALSAILLVILSLLSPAQAADPYIYGSGTVVKNSFLATFGRSDVYISLWSTNMTYNGWVPTYLRITNDSPNNYYFKSPAVAESAQSPTRWIVAMRGISYFPLVVNAAASGTIPINYAYTNSNANVGPPTTIITPILGSDVRMVGGTWRASGKVITMSATELINRSPLTTSNSLMVKVIASTTQYKGGSLSGYTLGQVSLAALKPGWGYRPFQRSVTYYRPPSGRFYTTIVLLEYDAATKQYLIRNYVAFGLTQF